MGTKTLKMPEDALVALLKTLKEETLVDIFWKTLVESDTSPLTREEERALQKAKDEFRGGKTIRWENLK
ncbi:MAG: hypothetical protein M0Z67_01405 [Nitrospiraceae bacterium]|nr:hypothetical protein [Nitrospiraceae bacterium]